LGIELDETECGRSKGFDVTEMKGWKTNSYLVCLKIINLMTSSTLMNVVYFIIYYQIRLTAFKGESCHGGTMSEGGLIMLVTANVDGTEKFVS
jgi:hypothetical protein